VKENPDQVDECVEDLDGGGPLHQLVDLVLYRKQIKYIALPASLPSGLNEIAQSNIKTNSTFATQNYPLPWTNPKAQIPALSLDPSDLPRQTASITDQPFCHNALDRQTHTQTNGQLEGIFHDYRLLSLYRECYGLTTQYY